MSSTARQLVHELEAFEPSKEEFDALFELEKAVDNTFPNPFGTSDDQESARKAEAIDDLQEQIRQTLGAERFADYQMAQDFGYQQIYRLVHEAGLGTPAARELYLLRQQAERQISEISLTPDLAPEEQTSLIENLRAKTSESIEALIGDAGRAQLERSHNERWLETLLSLPVKPSSEST